MEVRDKDNWDVEEGLEAEELRVAEMLRGLKRVSAPKNFELRLKGRLASAQRSELLPSPIWKLTRSAAPLAMMLLVATVSLFLVLYPTDETAVPDLTRTEGVAADEVASPPVMPAANEAPATEVAETLVPEANKMIVAAGGPIEDRRPGRQGSVSDTRKPADERPGGSIDSSLGYEDPILPRGLDLNTNSARSSNGVGPTRPVTAREVLSVLGIELGPKATVKAVRAGSIAERSGLKAGDVIEALNGSSIESPLPSPFTGSNITVRRDEKVINLPLVRR